MSWVVLTLLALLLSAWSAGSEMTWITANPLQWETWRSHYPYRWRIARFFLQHPRRLLITLVLFNNLSLVLFSAGLSHLLPLGGMEPLQKFWVETLLGTLVLLVVGEYLPKGLFQRWQLALLPTVVPFTGLVYLLFSPLVEMAHLLTTALFRLFRVEEKPLHKPLSREGFATLLQHAKSDFQDVLTRTLALSETPVREFMVPRREVVALPIQTPIEELHRIFVETELSRILIYEGTPDQIVGYVYVRSLLGRPSSIQEILEPVSFVPETMPATRLLEELVKEKRSLAVVVDARGGMAGLVTTEDLVEEVFGDIQDEYDEPQWLERTPEPGVYEFDARIEIDYLNEKYGLDLPTKEAVTLGGLALAHLGQIPAVGTSWEAYGFRWEVLAAIPQRLLTLRLHQL